MLKKYTPNIFFSLTENNDTNETFQIYSQILNNANKIKSKNHEEKNDSQIKNTILLKDILKSNSITQKDSSQNYFINYKSKISTKNGLNSQKNQKQKIKNQENQKIKTTFSNYYTDYIFKSNQNNNKLNMNNFTEITYKPEETEEAFELNIKEKTLKAKRLKYAGLYNTESNHKINLNVGINFHKSKDNFLVKKSPNIISPKNNKKIKQDKKKENMNNSLVKILNRKKGKVSENANHFIYINNVSENNNSNNNNISENNKNEKKSNEVNKINKNKINKKKTNNLMENKKHYKKKLSEQNMERNKNKKNDYENRINNKTSNKINIINERKHIFLSPIIRHNNYQNNNKSSSKKINKVVYNNLHQYKGANSTTNKEIKKILFKFNEKQKKATSKNKNGNKLANNKFSNKLVIKNNRNEKPTIQDDYHNLINMKKEKENSLTIKSEDKNTEKDFNLENNKINEKIATTKSKNMKDYFKMARKVLKNASHSLVEPVTNSNNNFYEDIDFRNKNNTKGLITNRNNYKLKDDDSKNYTIKKVPVFSEINIFPNQINKNKILFKNYEKNILNLLFIKNNNNNSEKNNNIHKCVIYFLDIKSIIALSSINKDFFNNLRSIYYKVIFNKIYKNKNIKLIKKLNNSIIQSVSVQYKSDIYETTSTQTPYLDIILNDIDRTFPYDPTFQKDGKNYKKLYNILTKYSNYNKDIGYAQGLNFLFANALLFYEKEKDAFFYIDAMIKKFKLKKFFAEKNSKLIEEIRKFSEILKKYNPEIVNFFDKKYIYHEFFSTGWILTLFSNAMESNNLFICWNFMNIFGWKFFYCFVIQILRFYKKIIFRTNENELGHLMKSLLKDKQFSDDLPTILKNTFIFMQKHILL